MKALPIEIFETIRQAAAKVWNDVRAEFNRPDAYGKTTTDRLVDKIQKIFENGKQVLTPEALKVALSYHEFSRETLTFQELLTIEVISKLSSALASPGIRMASQSDFSVL